MNYTVTTSRSASREFERLPKVVARRIAARIVALEQEPRPQGSVKLADTQDTWRIRVGEYRVIYSVDDKKKSSMSLAYDIVGTLTIDQHD